MTHLREWFHDLFHRRRGVAEARARVEHDSERMDVQVERFRHSADELEHRVYQVNHITEAINQLWRET